MFRPLEEAEPIKLAFGLSPPPGVLAAWGARAIYQPPNVDILWDRQGYAGQAGELKKLQKWLEGHGLPALRKALKKDRLYTNESREVRIVRTKYTIVANPRASYGYLYLGAWLNPTTDEVAG
jgi:cytoskeleton bundling-enhancing protein CbeA-like protein